MLRMDPARRSGCRDVESDRRCHHGSKPDATGGPGSNSSTADPDASGTCPASSSGADPGWERSNPKESTPARDTADSHRKATAGRHLSPGCAGETT
jgi:hypothetical protein